VTKHNQYALLVCVAAHPHLLEGDNWSSEWCIGSGGHLSSLASSGLLCTGSIHSYGSRHLQAQLSHSLIHAVITARLAESKTPTQFRYNDGPQGFRGKPGTSTSWPAALTVSTAWDVNLSNAWGVSLTDASKSCSA
jgi:hypothetical protein